MLGLAMCIAAGVAALGCTGSAESSPAGITSPSLPVTVAPSPDTMSTGPATSLPIDDGLNTSVPIRTGPATSVVARTCGAFIEAPGLPLTLCSRGDLVRSVQAEIALQLESDLAADGFFGGDTDDAVREYQEANDLTADGIVGPATWNALFGSAIPQVGATRGIAESWYRRSQAEAVEALKDQGFVVIDYEVCSGSVDQGLVRQIIGSDGTVYDDSDGVTDDGMKLSIGEVVEVKVSSGSPC